MPSCSLEFLWYQFDILKSLYLRLWKKGETLSAANSWLWMNLMVWCGTSWFVELRVYQFSSLLIPCSLDWSYWLDKYLKRTIHFVVFLVFSLQFRNFFVSDLKYIIGVNIDLTFSLVNLKFARCSPVFNGRNLNNL